MERTCIAIAGFSWSVYARAICLVVLLPCSFESASAFETYHVHNDHHGTPLVLTDRKAEIVWRARSSPFGVDLQVAVEQELALGFPGQRRDEESDLIYNYHRYYLPALSRYMRVDPIGLKGGFAVYGYANANPLSFIDPLGLAYQFSLGGSGAVAHFPFAVSFSASIGISIPEDFSEWRCYQLFFTGHAAPMLTPGAYAGVGGQIGTARSVGPLPVASAGVYRHFEAAAGLGPAAGFSVTGAEDIQDAPFRKAFDIEGLAADPAGAFSVGLDPGIGLGVFAGYGAALVGTIATPTLGDSCDCL